MLGDIIWKLLNVIRVRHFCLVLLAFTLALLGLNMVHFRLMPIWVLHLSSNHSTSHTEVLWSLATPNVGSADSGDLVVIRNEDTDSISKIATFRLPDFGSGIKRKHSEERNSQLHKLNPFFHAEVPFTKVLALSAVFWNQSLLIVTVSSRNTSSTDASPVYSLSTWDQKTGGILWERSIGPVATSATSARLVPSLLVSSVCVTSGRSHCGLIFVLFPTQKPDGDYHFSTLAVSIQTGLILWHHLPGDFGEDYSPGVHNITFPHWKLRLVAQHQAHLHIGESHWSVYRDVLFQALPLYWYGPEDSQIQLVHHHSFSDKLHTADASQAAAILVTHPGGVDLLNLASGRPLARLPLEWRPGATYANIPSVNESGIFGHSLTLRALHELRVTSAVIPTRMSGRGVHIRLSGQNVPGEDSHYTSSEDAAEPDVFHPGPTVHGQGDFSHQVDCRGRLAGLLETTASPSDGTSKPLVSNGHTVLYTGLCRPSGFWEYARLGQSDWLEDEAKSVPPLIIKHSSHPGFLRGFWNLIRLHDMAGWRNQHTENADRYDLVFLTSDGSLTSVSNEGHENWHVNAEVSWLQVSRAVSAAKSGQPLDPQLGPLYAEYFRPSMLSVQLIPIAADVSDWHSSLLGPACLNWKRVQFPRDRQKRGNRVTQSSVSVPALSVIMTTGWDSVSLIDPDSGRLLSTHRLPCRPTHSPTLIQSARSDSDGSVLGETFIIPCEGMLLAFGVIYEVRLIAFLLTALSLFISFVLIYLCCEIPQMDVNSQ
ncbi:hypothetical protein D915_003254 [Fasciola hepatica]|uniref:Uncharacterized protein n=1 Tax=Fasciola hepatica TaxID=6192 RepID=A0A4E0RBP3_FASHE|nr:hypothetical protein D915_003254 [Fasciola hepatica]